MPSYIKIGLRNLSKNSSYTLINIIGLTIGIASFLLIMMYVQYHLSFDQHIEKKHSLYRAVEIQHAQGVGDQHVAITMGPLGPALMKDFPEITNAVRLWPVGQLPIEINEKLIKERGVAFADTSVFNLLSIKLIHGNADIALDDINSVVVSERVALKYFNSTEEAMGKILKYRGEENFKITGVMQNIPETFHLNIEMIIPFATAENKYPHFRTEWRSNSFVTYVELAPNVDLDALEKKFPAFIEHYMSQYPDDGFYWDLYLQPLTDIHLKSNHIKFQYQVNMGDLQIVYIFSLIAFLILFIACINFINIAISRSIKRAKEVGMRKVIGANRMNLIYQFNSESIIITLLSIILSLGLVELLLPLFNKLLNTELAIHFISNQLYNIGLLVIFLGVSLITGLYPAYYLSKFKPLVVLKGSKRSVKGAQGLLTKILVALQFTITIALIFSIMVIQKQINFVQKKNLGYNYENVMEVAFFKSGDNEKADIIRAELLKNPDIIGVSAAASATGASGSQSFRATADSIPQRLMYRIGEVNPEFFELMEIPIVEGRNFSRDHAFDMKGKSIILNEIAVKELGWDNPIGRQFEGTEDDSLTLRTVIGVVRDYHYYSLRTKIEPAFFVVNEARNRTLNIKFSEPPSSFTKEQKQAYVNKNVNFVEDVWRNFFPNASFDYTFVEQRLHDLYNHERNSLSIFTYFAILSILISCLGLYGLISFVVEQRTNEIGVRKVMGGSVIQIVYLLIKDFIVLIVIAGIIASPLAIYLSEQFLQTFVYRVNMPYAYLIVSIVIALLIAIFTISFHAIKSANSNPVDALRYE